MDVERARNVQEAGQFLARHFVAAKAPSDPAMTRNAFCAGFAAGEGYGKITVEMSKGEIEELSADAAHLALDVEKQRDEWKRQAWNTAAQNQELRKTLVDLMKGAPARPLAQVFEIIEKALALTPTQAEKVVAAMEGLVSAVEAGLPSEFGDFTRVELDLIRDRLAALDAARKGE
jgi:hypothetical protein